MAVSLCTGAPFPTECGDALVPPHVCLGDPSDCIYCTPTYGDYHAPCAFNEHEYNSRCDGLVGGLFGLDEGRQPFFCVGFGPGTEDAMGSTAPFYSRVLGGWGECAYRYFLQADITLEVEPCAPLFYCLGSNWWAIKLCRWFIIGAGAHDAKGWKMLCNVVEMDEDGPAANQLAPRPFSVDLDMGGWTPAFIHLVAGVEQPCCFAPFQDVFCFTRRCDEPRWDCIGATHDARVAALDSPDIVCNVSYSRDRSAFPFGNPAEMDLKNAAWALVNGIVDRLDDSHVDGSYQSYDSRGKYLWAMTEVFDASNVTLQALGLPPYPAVVGRAASEDFPGGIYRQYTDVPIPLVCRARLTKAALPAELTIEKAVFRMHLHVEQKAGSTDHRVHADIYIWLGLRVRLLPEAYEVDWPLQLIGRPGGTDDPYDLRVEAAGESGVEHPHEILTPVGPRSERVWCEQSWRGLNSAPQFSRGVPWQDAGAGPPCCSALRAIDQLVIHPEINDCGELQANGTRVELPQRYQGWVSLRVDFTGVVGC